MCKHKKEETRYSRVVKHYLKEIYYKEQSKEINIYRQLNIANKIRWLSILLINPYQNDSQIDYYWGKIADNYASIETKKIDLTRFLNFKISMYCNKNQLNHYFFWNTILIWTIKSKRNFTMRFLFFLCLLRHLFILIIVL